MFVLFFFFQAEDGIRDDLVTGVQTCALPICVLYLNEQKYDLAIPQFQSCLQINSNDKQAKEMLESSQGISAYFQNNYSAAIDHFKNVLNVNPQNPNASIFLADAYVKLKQYPNAKATLKKHPAISKEGKQKTSEVLSKIYMDQQKYAEAITEFKNIVELNTNNSNNFSVYENLGVAYFQMKDYKNAAHYWEGASKIQKDAQTFKFLWFSYYNFGDAADAFANYKKSIQLESSKPEKEQNVESLSDTYFNLAVAYTDNNLFDDAADAFGAAFKANPKDSKASTGKSQAIIAAINAHMVKG